MKSLTIAAALATIVLKTGAWWMTGSVGLLSDAAESTVNLVAAIGALFALRIAARPADETHHYGHTKAEFFSAAAEGTMIFVAAAFIIWSAIQRIIEPQPLENVGIGLGNFGFSSHALAPVQVRQGHLGLFFHVQQGSQGIQAVGICRWQGSVMFVVKILLVLVAIQGQVILGLIRFDCAVFAALVIEALAIFDRLGKGFFRVQQRDLGLGHI